MQALAQTNKYIMQIYISKYISIFPGNKDIYLEIRIYTSPNTYFHVLSFVGELCLPF